MSAQGGCLPGVCAGGGCLGVSTVVDLRGTRDACPAGGSKFFQFHAVFGKIWQINMLALPWRVGAPTTGLPAWGGRGLSASGGVYLGGCTHPWTEFLTHACENITFPQLLLRMATNFEVT